jgi:hypothetical protein
MNMKNIRFLLVAFVGISLLMSCSNSKTGKSQSSEIQSEDVVTKSTREQNDTITGRGCFEIISETPYDIPAQRFDETAQALAHASGCFIESDLEKTGSVQVNAINGKMSIRDALLTAIEGTNLKITEETNEKITVELVQ